MRRVENSPHLMDGGAFHFAHSHPAIGRLAIRRRREDGDGGSVWNGEGDDRYRVNHTNKSQIGAGWAHLTAIRRLRILNSGVETDG